MRWLLEVFHQSGALFRKRYGYLGKGCAARYWWQAVLGASPHTAHGESPLLHEAFQPELEGSVRESGRQTAGYLPGRESPLLVSLTNQLGYNLSFPLSPLPTTFRLICGLEKSATIESLIA